jgi:hypothetical protein
MRLTKGHACDYTLFGYIYFIVSCSHIMKLSST